MAGAPTATRQGGGLESARLTAVEDLCEVELRLGHHYQVVDEIVGLVAAHPTRERLLDHAMVALHRTGRTAEALHAYHRHRHWLASELGIDPDARLRRRYVSLLRDGGETAMAGS